MELLSKDFSNFLKGVCCLVVIMVHIPSSYQNTIQDLIGSFAYVCVTIFFMISAYGMLYCSRQKDGNYLLPFWQNRLASLLVPCIGVNLFIFVISSILTHPASVYSIIKINGYIVALLQWCLIFYIVEYARVYFGVSNRIADITLSTSVVAMSLCFYVVESKIGNMTTWPYERMGLLWGLLLYRYQKKISGFIHKKLKLKIIIQFFVSVLLGLIYIRYKYIFFWGEFLLKIILGLALISVIISFGKFVKINYNLGVVKWLGAISFVVYLSHYDIMCIIDDCSTNLTSWEFIILTYVSTIFVASILTPLFKKIVKSLRKE